MLKFADSRYWSIAFVLIAYIICQIGFNLILAAVGKRFQDTKGPSAKTSLGFFLLFMGVTTVITGPLLEELLFRAWLIVFFKKLSLWSWLDIVVSGIIFGKLHKSGSAVTKMFEFIQPKTTPFFQNKNAQRARVFSTAGLGILCGYLIVRYQSLYFGVIAHAAWNLLSYVMLFIVPLIRRKISQGWVIRDCQVTCQD
jgi:membrane protease YdiL (CAAX protease family)